MQVTIAKRVLAQALTSAKAVADTSAKPSMPILGDVVLRGLTDGGLRIQSTDMLVSLTETVEADVAKPGAAAVSVKKLSEIVNVLPEGDVNLAAEDNAWLRITSGRSVFKLMGHMETDFPALPMPHEKATVFEVSSAVLLDLIDKVSYAMSSDAARVNLYGLFLEADGQSIQVVATDGHRLTLYRRPIEGLTIKPGIVIARDGIDRMATILKRYESVELIIDPLHLGHQRSLFAKAAGALFSCKVVNVAFPPYQQVIPSKPTRETRVATNDLTDALRRAITVAPEKTINSLICFGADSLRIEVDNPDVGTTRQEIEATTTGNPCDQRFNARYVLEAVSKMDGDGVTIRGHKELDPIVVGDDNYTAVVMPMRV